jgi:RNA polymerase sigma-70 factor (ECF subfamily)
METETDQLIRQIRGGETECYAEIIRRFEQPVWRVVAAMLQDFEQSRELLQQVFVEAYLHLDQYELGRDFEIWIKAIARNAVRQELRRLARKSANLEFYRQALERRWADESVAQKDELRYLEALADCRQELPLRSAQAVELRYEQGRSFDEIATMLETSRSAAEKLLSRVRVLLKKCIERRIAQAGT